MMNYFNDLRAKGIEVNQNDTLWIETFCKYVLKNKLISHSQLQKALHKTINVLTKGQSTTEVIDLLRKFEIDYAPIDKQYEISLTQWKEILCSLHDNGD